MAPAPRMPAASQFVLDADGCPNPPILPARICRPALGVCWNCPLCAPQSRTLLASARAFAVHKRCSSALLWWRGSPLQPLIAASLP